MATAPFPPCPGRVALVGAGPGDPELLTLKALRAIRHATLLLVDDLVGDEILACAPPAARIVHVGKRGGCPSTPQAFIEKLMIAEARAGARVVRLKGGDPLLFGRGGEEQRRLEAAGVPVDIVSGITAGIAAGACLGIPLTDRDHAHGVAFVTGHARDGHRVDWPALATASRQARLTLVIYMGMAQIAEIQAGLLDGLPPDTPVAVVSRASLPTQRHAVARLDTLADTVRTHALRSPAIVIVGDVVRGMAACGTRAADGADAIGLTHANADGALALG